MTNEQAIEMMKAKLECMTREVNGTDQMCNAKKCDECDLCYEQGNMGEQKEWLKMGINALENQKTGHWDIEFEPRKNKDEWDRLVCKCSECGTVLVKQMYNKDTMNYDECVADFRQDITFRHAYYCKHCGAKMEEKQ